MSICFPCHTTDRSVAQCDAFECVMRASRVQDMQAALEAAGVAHISCNPVTANSAAKALLGVAQAERMPLSKEQAHSLAGAANGDLRNALEMLQLLAVGQDPTLAAPKAQKVTPHHSCSALCVHFLFGYWLPLRLFRGQDTSKMGALQPRSIPQSSRLLDMCSLGRRLTGYNRTRDQWRMSNASSK